MICCLCDTLFDKKGVSMVRRKDKNGRVLEKGESQRKEGKYVFQYNICGQRKCVYANSLSELREREKQINKDISDNIDTSKSVISLNEQFDKYMSIKIKLANSTKENYLGLWDNHVRHSFLGNKSIGDIKKTDILRFYTMLAQKGLKYSTIKAYDCMISPCFDLAIDDDIIRKNPSKGCLKEFYAKDAAEKTALTLQEQEELLIFVQKSAVYKQYLPLIIFMLGTGARCGETIGLTWNDVDFENREISIDHQIIYKKLNGKYVFYAESPKTESGIRKIPMTNSVYHALLQQKKQQFQTGTRTKVVIDGYADFVFSTKNNNPMMPGAVNSVLKNIVNKHNISADIKCKLPHLSAHILRHTACTRMAEVGMDVKVLQYIMGHSRISVTMEVYNHISPERNRKEIDKLEKIGMIV